MALARRLALLGAFFTFLFLAGCKEDLPPEVRKARANHSVGNNHPIEFPHISGSFGEYRSGGRFHHGLDYKTFNRNGIPIVAVEDMTVARLYTSEVGYGNGLVLSSVDGRHFTYGHMHDFMGKHPQLEYLRMALFLMHPRNRASVNLPGYFAFKKGEVIGRSGESGSGAPHLHFEVGSGGYFKSPLEDPERAIQDFTAPTLLRLHTRTRAYELKQVHRQYTKQGHTIDTYALAVEEPLSSADYRIGTYDTMAALNRNGVHGVRLYFLGNESLNLESHRSQPEEIAVKPEYKMELDGIATSELRTADRYYDPEKTSIGSEYVYYLYDTLRRNRSELNAGLYLVEVLDSSGNKARLLFEIGQATDADLQSEKPELDEATGTEQEDPLIRQNDVPFRNLAPYAGANFSYNGEGISLNIQIPGGMQQGRAKARILEPTWIRAMPPVRDGLTEPAGGVRAFVFDARDLVVSGYMYISGSVEKKHPDEELYLWNPTTGRWDWLGKPYRETETRAYYNLRLKRGGIVAILRDTGSPVIHPSFAWQRPEDDLIHSGNKDNPVALLEFDIYDEQSWIDRDTTAVFLDGIPLDYEWAGDRSLLRVSVPEKWMNGSGSFLSIQVKDLAGNPAEPFFQAIYPH